MCDYSLMTFPNRLAKETEILVTQKFSTGSIGFVSLEELSRYREHIDFPPTGFWNKLKAWYAGPTVVPDVTAVCIPPGGTLKVRSIPERTRKTLEAQPGDVLTFTQITASWN